jgi:uncharacterized protein YegP (UPF0339 family)
MGKGKANVEVYRRADGQYDWRIIAGNGATLGGSAQGYTERGDAVEGLRTTLSAIVNDVLVLGQYVELAGAQVLIEVPFSGSEETTTLAVPFDEVPPIPEAPDPQAQPSGDYITLPEGP